MEARSANGVDTAPPLWSWQTLLSGLATLILLASLAAAIDWRSTWSELIASHKGFVLLGGLCHYLTYPVRGARWRLCLAHLQVRQAGAGFGLVVFFQNFVDNVVPAKLGDVYGAHLARINFGVRRSEAIGSIVFQRMIDSWIVLLLSFLASWSLLSHQLPSPFYAAPSCWAFSSWTGRPLHGFPGRWPTWSRPFARGCGPAGRG